jgi:hypothetical protein
VRHRRLHLFCKLHTSCRPATPPIHRPRRRRPGISLYRAALQPHRGQGLYAPRPPRRAPAQLPPHGHPQAAPRRAQCLPVWLARGLPEPVSVASRTRKRRADVAIDGGEWGRRGEVGDWVVEGKGGGGTVRGRENQSSRLQRRQRRRRLRSSPRKFCSTIWECTSCPTTTTRRLRSETFRGVLGEIHRVETMHGDLSDRHTFSFTFVSC